MECCKIKLCQWSLDRCQCDLSFEMCGVNSDSIKNIADHPATEVPQLIDLLPPIIKHDHGINEECFLESPMHHLVEGTLKTLINKILSGLLKKHALRKPVFKAANELFSK